MFVLCCLSMLNTRRFFPPLTWWSNSRRWGSGWRQRCPSRRWPCRCSGAGPGMWWAAWCTSCWHRPVPDHRSTLNKDKWKIKKNKTLTGRTQSGVEMFARPDAARGSECNCTHISSYPYFLCTRIHGQPRVRPAAVSAPNGSETLELSTRSHTQTTKVGVKR